jgi:riboflavin synthase
MFTGIVEELGTVRAVRHGPAGARLDIAASAVLADAAIGASISVDGACLTVVELGADHWCADVVAETLARTTLGRLAAGDRVNLERPLRADGRLGGHVVLGHVDGTVPVLAIEELADGTREVRFGLTDALAPLVVEKGSVAVDGVSLTVTTVDDESFGVALIPHTLACTTLGLRRVGDRCNLEVDYLAKVVHKLASPYATAAGGAR